MDKPSPSSSKSRKNAKRSSKLTSSNSLQEQISSKKDRKFHSRFFNEYEKIEFYAKGSFGCIFKCKQKTDGCFYAVKQVDYSQKTSLRDKAIREVQVLARLHHDSVVRYFTSWKEEPPAWWVHETNEKIMPQSPEGIDMEEPEDTVQDVSYLYIQMELCQKHNLQDWLDKIESRKKSECLIMFQQLIEGVKYIHSLGLVHRDLKPSNILFSIGSDKIKIGDFGSVAATKGEFRDLLHPPGDQLHSPDVGTQTYIAPEQSSQYYTEKVDIFPLGLILCLLMKHFKTKMELSRFINKARMRNFPPDLEKSFPKVTELAKEMLQENPVFRPSAECICRNHLLKQKEE